MKFHCHDSSNIHPIHYMLQTRKVTDRDEVRVDVLDVLHEDELDPAVVRVQLQPVGVQLAVADLPRRVERAALGSEDFYFKKFLTLQHFFSELDSPTF